MESILRIVLGALALLVGRKLFWVFVAIVGFLFAAELVAAMLPPDAIALRIALPIVAGILGALLAILAERIAFGIAGFFATAYLVLAVVEALGGHPQAQLIALVGGVFGAVIAVSLMDWALIVLSSLLGAAVIVEEVTPMLSLAGVVQLAAVAGLTVAGILVQWTGMRSRRKRRSEESAR